MSLEFTRHTTWTEDELCIAIANAVYENYPHFKNCAYFLKLERVDSSHLPRVRVAWIKFFTSSEKCTDFYFESKYEPCCIRVHFRRSEVSLFSHGFEFDINYLISESSMRLNSIDRAPCEREKHLMVPREILDAAFMEFEDKLRSK